MLAWCWVLPRRVRGNFSVAFPFPAGLSRVCGGTDPYDDKSAAKQGLSPRVRGNHGLDELAVALRGSIPRVRGTRRHHGQCRPCHGLSPRVRGNPLRVPNCMPLEFGFQVQPSVAAAVDQVEHAGGLGFPDYGAFAGFDGAGRFQFDFVRRECGVGDGGGGSSYGRALRLGMRL